jgi:hypothetical protein
MCPMCIATVALIATGVTSTGGLSALVVRKKLGARRSAKRVAPTTQTAGGKDGTTENGFAG